ncbi:beta-ketoacyl-[acyl-carrier-protein] synthase family protein [Streptomyces iconiensis]|uniref:Beta-ketoacyl-[acyl-carrier-protein] synthase family protein n=1 Tax=Streptomyces iconiensis TaxID=1384038 RepID=A0ABT6ZN51_9ACTN|nr:beta-ketoacyl-[acyl-carrier-protein] synthase family protein [Streptomyces iconiensis]MDJ1130487.1 beta-ketoacyl-[acyl-carrier-protein] synthase family protein [Streptomyces iconiensis]
MTAEGAAITGIGMVTPSGVGVQASWAGILSGKPTAEVDDELAGLPVAFSCRVPDLDACARLTSRLALRLDRFTQMALIAAHEAVADAGLNSEAWHGERVAVVMGVGTASFDRLEAEVMKLASDQVRKISPLMIPRSIPNMASGEISLALKARGPSFATSTACASGATALGTALLLLRAGACDIAIAGGAESVRNRISAVGFSQLGALSTRSGSPAAASRPFDTGRDGFVLSEGAAVLVLERPAHARGRGARTRAILSGYGATCDAHHPTAPPVDGRGAAAALRMALADASLTADDIGHINAHGTSTPLNDAAECQALQAVFPQPPPTTSNKGVWGHSIGAAGAIEAAVTALTLEHQLLPPTANHTQQDPAFDLDIVTGSGRHHQVRAAVSNSFGFGGHNAVLILTVG